MPGERFGFKFPFPVEDHPDALVKVRFTDDAGLQWEIGHDMHLEKLENRDDW